MPFIAKTSYYFFITAMSRKQLRFSRSNEEGTRQSERKSSSGRSRMTPSSAASTKTSLSVKGVGATKGKRLLIVDV